LKGTFVDHESHESVATRKVLEGWLDYLESRTKWDLSAVGRMLDEPTGADHQLEVWRETGSATEVARDIAQRTRDSIGY
jgi:carboxylate-amine ligase